MVMPVGNDENQFIASGKLLAAKGYLPYIDYPYFQTPNLVFIYAVIFKFTSWLLLAGRAFSVISSWTILAVIFFICSGLFKRYGPGASFIAAAASVLILLSNPIFVNAGVPAWNHSFPLLAALAAFVLHVKAHGNDKPPIWLFLGGFALGIAAGTRLYYMTLLIPMFLTVFTFPKAHGLKEKLKLSLNLLAGSFVALIPSFLFLLAAPKKFIFNVFTYHTHIDKLYLSDALRLTTFIARAGDCFILFFTSSPALLTVIFCCTLIIWFAKPSGLAGNRYKFEITLALWFIVFTLINALCLRGITFNHIYSATFPFMALAVFYVIASLDGQSMKKIFGIVCFIAIISTAFLIDEFREKDGLLSPGRWYPVSAHLIGNKMAGLIGGGKVLTLSPIFPLEGGLDIYREFAASPFAWRVAKFVKGDDRAKFMIVSEDELRDLLEKDPPRAIIVGYNKRLDDIFRSYAKENNFKRMREDRMDLFIAY
jgi:4-amino-4-deoxy-L-arabinose transferase-like glycosyltransferase